MCRKLNSLLMLALLVSVAGSASAELVGHWTFDDVTGTSVPDLAGSDDTGTLVNLATISASTAPVPSGTTHAAQFSGAVGDRIELVETGNLAPGEGDWSLALWFNTSTVDPVPGGVNKQFFYSDGASGQNAIVFYLRTDTVEEGMKLESFFRDGGNNRLYSHKAGLGIEANVWYHYAVTRSGGEMNVYLDAALVDTVSGTLGNVNTSSGGVVPSIGGHPQQGYGFNGLIDEVRVYNHALTEAEINDLATPVGGRSQARDPNPPHGATGVPNKVALTWTPGDYAPATNGHRVYFSQSFDDVNDGLPAALKGIQSAARYPETGTLTLEVDQTYYWRVDEANSVSEWDEGNVWQFTVEPVAYPLAGENITATACSYEEGEGPENTVNGLGLDENDLHSTNIEDMWLSGSEPQGAWIEYEFDKVYKLHEMWVWNYNGQGLNTIYGLKDVTIEYSSNGADYTTLGTTHEFDEATGADSYEHNTVVDFGGVVAKCIRITATSNWSGGFADQYGLSEVRFYYIPVRAREPEPASGATDLDPDVVLLSWKPGRQAASHNVYLSTYRHAVLGGTAPVTTVSESGFDPGPLELGRTYYWKVNEVNTAEDPNTWEGDVWSFSTLEYLVVDDMESYGDAEVVGEPGSRIWYTWKDGEGWISPAPTYSGNGTGAVVDLVVDDPVHGGKQSLWYSYKNDGTNVLGTSGKAFYSEITAELADLGVEQDWTGAGVKALSLWFKGQLGPVGGATELSPGVYTITSAGAGIGGQSDEFHFAYQQLASGENTIIARIDSIDNTDEWAKAGVMIRDTLDADSRHAMVAVTPGHGVIFQWRTDTGAGSAETTTSGITAPYWVKLERTAIGNCVAYYSPDGTEGSWTQIGDFELIAMNSPSYVGLALTSHNIGAACEAKFSNVRINDSVPTGLSSQDIGVISNDRETLYIALEDADGHEATVSHDDPNAVLTPTWREWNIDLSRFDSAGVDLTKVKKVAIGVGDRNAAAPGGTGTMYFDDIALYPARCIPELGQPEGDLNNDCKVDCLDVQMMAGDWLLGDFTTTTGLVGHWTFDNVVGTSVPDLAGGDDNGTLLGGASIVDADAPWGVGTTKAAKFSALGDQIELRETGNLSPGTGPWSYAGWFKLDGTGGERGNCLYAERGGTGKWGPAAIVINIAPAGELDLFFRDLANQNISWVTEGLGIQNDVWYHLAVVRDGGTIKAYLNGQFATEKSGTLNNMNMAGVSATTPIGNYPRFGMHPNQEGLWQFGGLMDEVRVYKRLLTDADVMALHSGGDVSTIPDPLYFPLTSPANLSDDEPENSKKVNFKDFSILAEDWLVEELWP